jgi:hypothetical protein
VTMPKDKRAHAVRHRGPMTRARRHAPGLCPTKRRNDLLKCA